MTDESPVIDPVTTTSPLEVADLPVSPSAPTDGTVTLDFGPAGQLTGCLMSGGVHHSSDGDETDVLVPMGESYVTITVPVHLLTR